MSKPTQAVLENALFKCQKEKKELILEFLDVLKNYPFEKRTYEQERYIRYHTKKWEKRKH